MYAQKKIQGEGKQRPGDIRKYTKVLKLKQKNITWGKESYFFQMLSSFFSFFVYIFIQ